mmetsp:Transcript_24580/g.68520  ORF Transcript_24580/g.68520 Transcript_24580/m.68520 type:complete len:245 (+) Transcript_24580:657-1391(+)
MSGWEPFHANASSGTANPRRSWRMPTRRCLRPSFCAFQAPSSTYCGRSPARYCPSVSSTRWTSSIQSRTTRREPGRTRTCKRNTSQRSSVVPTRASWSGRTSWWPKLCFRVGNFGTVKGFEHDQHGDDGHRNCGDCIACLTVMLTIAHHTRTIIRATFPVQHRRRTSLLETLVPRPGVCATPTWRNEMVAWTTNVWGMSAYVCAYEQEDDHENDRKPNTAPKHVPTKANRSVRYKKSDESSPWL